MNSNFEKLDELIKDEDKIVTVASFARDLNISIEEASNTIAKYVKNNKASNEIYVTYVLSGRKKGEQKISVILIKDQDLENEKQLYDEEVKVMIFSIQKSRNIDYNIIALVDPINSVSKTVVPSGALIGKNCIKRALRKKILPPLPTSTVRGKSTVFVKQNSTKSEEKIKLEEDIDISSPSHKNKPNIQSGIASLFNKGTQKVKDEKATEKKQKSNGNLTNFLTKNTNIESLCKEIGQGKDNENKKEANTKESLCKEIRQGKDNENKKENTSIENKVKTQCLKLTRKNEDNMDISKKSIKQEKKSELIYVESDTDDEMLKGAEAKEINIKEDKKKSGQKRRRAKDNGQKSVKKRRRIIVEDSDSDDIFESDGENKDLIENSDEDPEAELTKVEKELLPLPPKNKRRKTVQNTYEDDEGFIVTQTEYVYETASEDESESKTKIINIEEKEKPKILQKKSNNLERENNPQQSVRGKKTGNKKTASGSQPTLMNFFKKK